MNREGLLDEILYNKTTAISWWLYSDHTFGF